jgi:hypothetical protein
VGLHGRHVGRLDVHAGDIGPGNAQVIAAALAFLGVAVTAFVGVAAAAWRRNGNEHAENGSKLDTVIVNQSEIRREVQFIRSDVTDIHGAITELRHTDHDTDERVTRLERHHKNEGDDT